jgi:hypothetical protein
LNYAVKITQDITPNIGVWLVDAASGNEIQELVFYSAAGVQPAAREFYLRWAPLNVAVVAGKSTAIGDIPFEYAPTGSDTPGVDPMTSIGGSTGEYFLTIQPPALSAEEVALKPFTDKISKVEFAVSSGGSTVSRNLYLRQAHFHTVADVVDNYRPDGSVYSFNIRSNSEWVVKPGSLLDPAGVLEPTSVAAFLAQSGGHNYDPDPGTAFSFQLIDNTDLSSGGQITFILADPTRRVPEVTVTLNAYNCGMNGTAALVRIGDHDYLTHRYANKCWMVQNSIEGTATYTLHDYSGGVVNGYYYSQANRASACPDGWRVPNNNDALELSLVEIDPALRAWRWWVGEDGMTNGAYAGYYANGFGAWGTNGRWWTNTANFIMGTTNLTQAFYGSGGGANHCYTVRCVKDITN